jgi:hypothetical protein
MENARDERYEGALKRAKEIKEFYVHLGVYVIVNSALFAINMISNPDTLWFYWPALGWGIGLTIHAFSLLTEGRILDETWEDRKAREIMRRDERRRGAA